MPPKTSRKGFFLIPAGLILSFSAFATDDARLQQFRDAVGNDRQAVARNWLLSVTSDQTLDENTRELLLYDGLLALGSLASPDDETTSAVRALLSYASVSTTTLTEGRRQLTVPLHDVGSAARLTLGNWRIRATKDEILGKVALGQAPLPTWSGDPEDDRLIAAGLKQALTEMPADQLTTLRMQISSAFDSDPRFADSVLLIARRQGNVLLYRQLATLAPPRVAIDMLRDIDRTLDPGQSLAILDLVRSRDELASAAILAIGRLQASYPDARERLFTLLADARHGASAASALARYGDTPGISRLGTVILDADAGTARQSAILALRLHASPAARSELARLATNPRLSPNLREEIGQWLAQ
jgi:hypothetical protein